MKEKRTRRFLEILPGLISWFIILFLFGLLFINPLVLAVILIVYLIYWSSKLLFMTLLLVIANHRVRSKRNIDWLSNCSVAKTIPRLGRSS